MKAFLVVVGLLVVGCTPVAIVNPPSGPGTPYPCGKQGVVCPHAMCCWTNDTCGGSDPTCPSGQCCFIGAPDDHDNLGEKRPRMHPQTPQASITSETSCDARNSG